MPRKPLGLTVLGDDLLGDRPNPLLRGRAGRPCRPASSSPCAAVAEYGAGRSWFALNGKRRAPGRWWGVAPGPILPLRCPGPIPAPSCCAGHPRRGRRAPGVARAQGAAGSKNVAGRVAPPSAAAARRPAAGALGAPAGLAADPRAARISDATQNAIARVTTTARNVRRFEVVQARGEVSGGKVAQHQVTLKVGFTLDEA